MTRKTENIAKGMGAGLAAGIVMGIAGSALMNNKNKSKKMLRKAVTKVEDLLDQMQGMFA